MIRIERLYKIQTLIQFRCVAPLEPAITKMQQRRLIIFNEQDRSTNEKSNREVSSLRLGQYQRKWDLDACCRLRWDPCQFSPDLYRSVGPDAKDAKPWRRPRYVCLTGLAGCLPAPVRSTPVFCERSRPKLS